jgi:hypothetical protein
MRCSVPVIPRRDGVLSAAILKIAADRVRQILAPRRATDAAAEASAIPAAVVHEVVSTGAAVGAGEVFKLPVQRPSAIL